MAKITLNWTASTGPVVGYKIYRSTTTFDQSFISSLTPIADVESTSYEDVESTSYEDVESTSYEDTSIILDDQLYYYGVAAYDASGNQVLSEVIEVAMIGAPTSLTAVFSPD